MAELTRFILGEINSLQKSWPIEYSPGIPSNRIFRKSKGGEKYGLERQYVL